MWALYGLSGPVIGSFIGFGLFPSPVLNSAHAFEGTILVWVLLVAALTVGLAFSIRSIVQERHVFEHRRRHLSVSAYLLSKAAFLGCVAAVNAGVLATIGLQAQTLPPTRTSDLAALPTTGLFVPDLRQELVLEVVCVAVAATFLGLLLSSLVAGEVSGSVAWFR